jgi:hypothetical protein
MKTYRAGSRKPFPVRRNDGRCDERIGGMESIKQEGASQEVPVFRQLIFQTNKF